MPPSGLAILLGAGPTSGAGIARVLADPAQGNLAVALLSRSVTSTFANELSGSTGGGVLRAFQTDTSQAKLETAFGQIREWADSLSTPTSSKPGEGDGKLKLSCAIWHVKHSHRTPFLDEAADKFSESIQTYISGAMHFSQLSLNWMLAQYPEWTENENPLQKRGTIIFTGTLGALRTNPGYAAYGAGRAGVRMLAQSLAREFSAKGVHVVHAIANGGIADVRGLEGGTSGDGESDESARKVSKGERMRAESVGRLYLSCVRMECDLWVHELDMRPAAEKF